MNLFTTNCLLCQNKLKIDNDDLFYVPCLNKRCNWHAVFYKFKYLSNPIKMNWSFTTSYQNKQYIVVYQNEPLSILIRNSERKIICKLPIESLTDIILTPDNFEKKFPTILTYY